MVAERSFTPEEAIRPSRSGGGHLRLVEPPIPPPIPELPDHFTPENADAYYAAIRPAFFTEGPPGNDEVKLEMSKIPLFHPLVETAEQRAYNRAVKARYTYFQHHGAPDVQAYVESRKATHLGEQPSRELPIVEPGVMIDIPFYMVEKSTPQPFPPEIEELFPEKGTIFEDNHLSALAADE